ncbi:MAG: 3-methyl-2-oxobutanoate hydroxymethyltransferase [Bdellovibrionota bacterium]
MKTILDFYKMKTEKKKISMVTSYDYWSANLLNETEIDCLLVGDSLAQVMHGHPSTVHADTELMALHTRAVARGAPDKFIVADMPFLSVRKGLISAMESVDQLMKAGASSVKVEGIAGHEDIVKNIVESGVPVMGHLGLTPQSVHQLGGYKVQGKDKETADFIFQSALKLQELGCFSLVLECVPTQLATDITNALQIPVIGIGAGPYTDGQVLVFHDLLGLTSGHKPKFLKTFSEGRDLFKGSLEQFDLEVKENIFPSTEESY